VGRFFWPFGSRDNVLILDPVQNYDKNGELVSIVFIPDFESKLIDEVSFDIGISENNSGSASINFLAKVKLSKFLDFFFSLKSYKKNTEWYIIKLTENLRESLKEYH